MNRYSLSTHRNPWFFQSPDTQKDVIPNREVHPCSVGFSPCPPGYHLTTPTVSTRPKQVLVVRDRLDPVFLRSKPSKFSFINPEKKRTYLISRSTSFYLALIHHHPDRYAIASNCAGVRWTRQIPLALPINTLSRHPTYA